jgi:hypothetical protein
MSASGLRETIACELAARVKRLHPDVTFVQSHPHYVTDVAMNLGPGIDFETVRGDFRSGSGGEIGGGLEGPDKLCAVHSSAALVLNTFGPFRSSPQVLQLLGYSGFRCVSFEEQLPTALKGVPPTLGFCAYGSEAIVAVEGKFTEVLATRSASFSDSYLQTVSDLADSRWTGMYRSLCANPRRFRFLDAAQLVKHYLGIRRSLADEPEPKWLLYVFWEPSNWAHLAEFAQHRYEVLAFSVAVSRGDVEFSAMSYPELWDAMEDWSDWPAKREQLSYLRERYVFEL